jgi:hypothetical protein
VAPPDDDPRLASGTEDDAAKWTTRKAPFLLVLVLQNLLIYRDHYFGGVGFPWDFSMLYYALVAFWTATVEQGVFPQWVPFQQMGYPFALQVQSGINYPPLWIFPALRIPYTLHAAIVFQCLHVLAGSIGMFMLARQLLASSPYAMVAAISFQFFGGFYSNAEHVDIVRAFAYAPWLFYVFSLDQSACGRLPLRAMLIPAVLCLFLTGAYPGNVISSAVMIALFLAFQILDAWRRGGALSRLAGLTVRVVGLSLLGCGMAILQFGPVWLFRDHFFRGDPLSVANVSLSVEHLPGLFLSSKTLPGEISMTSTYVSLPILLLACFTTRAVLKRWWVYMILGAVAALMATGDTLAIGSIVRKAIPVLGLSRFPSSDYRVFVAIPLILFAILGLRAIVEKQLSGNAIAIRSAVCLAWLIWGLAQVYPSVARNTQSLVALAVAIASLLTILMLRRGRARLTLTGVAAVGLLISLDAVRVIPDLPGWHEPDIEAYYSQARWPPYTRNRGRRLVASSILRKLPPTRPPRIVPAGLVRWSGYFDGSYLATDLTPNVLRASHLVLANALYQDYMLRGWSPLLVNRAQATHGESQVVLTDPEIARCLADMSATGADSVKQTRYGMNDIVYQVELHEPRLLVENEMYFPGWRATLATDDTHVIDAVSVNGIFRSWWLPPGKYTMVARFEFPHLLTFRLVCATSLFIWLCLLFAWRRRAPSS